YLPALLLKGAAEYSLGNLTAARACVEQAEQLRPGWWLNALNSSIIERDQGHWEEAERDLGHAFDAFPNGGDASGRQMLHQARSVMYYRRGQMDQARQDWEQAYKSAPKDAAIFPTDRQRIFCQNWDWVMDYYAFLETKTPGSPVLPLMRGEMALRAERWQQAVDDFSVVITRQPALEDSCLFRGQAYEKLGQRERALDDYRRALRVTDRSHIRRLAQEGLRRLE
ncbi:MAG: tetratricopeptide repeat protein, partial [Anaerolineae bacterium]|nr:tetratricopeptide repeat protein [Anaerolineae bacterium]